MTQKRSSIPTTTLGLMLVLGGGCGPSRDCPLAPYADPSPHQAGVVVLSDDVRLHHLDFGGSGEALIFLAGAGNSAHVFDDFAPRFVEAFHVFALTRRGFGESSQPTTGYDAATLANDVVSVMDALNIDRASIAGHSIAGFEMTQLAVSYPERVRKLIYLDAAYDWAAAADNPPASPAPSQPNPTAAQLASPEAFAAYTAWLNGVSSFPLSDVRATNTFDCSGRYLGSRTPAAIAASFATQTATAHPEYASLTVPALAIYTVPESAIDLFPWLTQSSSQWQVATAYLAFAQASLASQRATFAAAAPSATVIEMAQTPHFLFLAQPDAVASTMRLFLP